MENVNQSPQNNLTAEDVWKMFEKTDAQMQETDRKLQETAAQMKETDRKMQETDRRMKETDKMIKELRDSHKELGRLFQDTDKKIKATGEHVDKMSKAVDNLLKKQSKSGNEWGRFLEEMCVPATIRIFMEEGIQITQRYTGMTHAYDEEGDEMEVDVILCNTTEAVAIEVKSSCSKDDIDHFIKQMKVFKKVFHPFDKFKVYAAIVGMRFQNGVEKYARKQGLYVITCTAEGVFSLTMKPESQARLCYGLQQITHQQQK